MLFHVHTTYHVPREMDPEVRADLIQRDRDHLAGRTVYRSVAGGEDFTLIDAPNPDAAHEFIACRPVSRYARVVVTPVVTVQDA